MVTLHQLNVNYVINPNYAPQTYKHPGEVRILGVVKKLRRKP